jgi:hypothetical protein
MTGILSGLIGSFAAAAALTNKYVFYVNANNSESVVSDSNENAYIVGGNQILKVKKDGTVAWATTITNFGASGRAVTFTDATTDGTNVYAVGFSVAGSARPLASVALSCSTGSVVWAKHSTSVIDNTSSGSPVATKIVLDKATSSFLYIGCQTQGVNSKAPSESILVRLSASDGSKSFVKTLGFGSISGIDTDSSGNLYTSVDSTFEVSSSAMQKFNSDLSTCSWNIGSTGTNSFSNIVHYSGNIYIYDGSQTALRKFTSVTSSSATTSWSKNIGNHNTFRPKLFSIDASENIYVSRGTALTKLDSSGTVSWNRTVTGNTSSSGSGKAVHINSSSGDVFFTAHNGGDIFGKVKSNGDGTATYPMQTGSRSVTYSNASYTPANVSAGTLNFKSLSGFVSDYTSFTNIVTPTYTESTVTSISTNSQGTPYV